MPESLATRCGSMSSSQQAWMIAARDRVVAAAGAQRRDLAFVVAARVADLVVRPASDGAAGLGDVGHASSLSLCCRMAWPLTLRRRRTMRRAMRDSGDEARGDRRAVVVQHRDQPRRVDSGLVRPAACAAARRGSARRRTPCRARRRSRRRSSGNGKARSAARRRGCPAPPARRAPRASPGWSSRSR